MEVSQAQAAVPRGLVEVARLCETFGIATLQPQLRACMEFARSQGVVDVAVLGQFKAGKSSFLNSLIGADILPVDVLPATAVITRLAYGERDTVWVHFLSGECREVLFAELATYVTEAGNPGNAQQVDVVEVELSAMAPFRGLRFVDTPGLGSVHAHNTQASLDWLPKIGGALVAISATQPFGAEDLKLLQDVARHTPEILLLMTKADLLSEGQQESVLEFTQFQVAQHTGRQASVMPYSTRPGHDGLRRNVREHLLREIGGRHEELHTRILEHKVRALAGACQAYLQLAQAAASSAAEARAELQGLLGQERAGFQALKHEIAVFVRDLHTRLRSGADERFQRFRGEVSRRLRTSLQQEMAGWKGNLYKRSRRFQAWLEAGMQEEMVRISGQGAEFLGDFLTEAQTSLQRMVRAFQDRLGQAIFNALGIRFEGSQFHGEIVEPRRPDVRIGMVFDTQIDLLWFLIPMGIFGPLFGRHFLGLVPWEVEKNLSRLANQWAESTNTSIDGLVAQAMDFVDQEVTTLETLALSSEDRRDSIQAALDVLATLRPDLSGGITHV